MKVLAWLNFIVLGAILFIAANSLRKEEKKNIELQARVIEKNEMIYQLETRIEKEQLRQNDSSAIIEKDLNKIEELELQILQNKKEIFEVKQKNDILQKDLSEKDLDMDRMIKVLKAKKLKI